MSETKNNPNNTGHHSGPQSHGEQKKGEVTDQRSGNQSRPGQPGKPAQKQIDRGESQKYAKPDIQRGGIEDDALGQDGKSPSMSHKSKVGSNEYDEDQDEREESEEKKKNPYKDGQSSRPGRGQDARDAGRVTGNRDSFKNP